MRFDLIARIRGLFQPHEVVHMKEHEFETGCDDLGQYEGSVEKQVAPFTAASAGTAAKDAAMFVH
jgi:hypothetical protein